MAIHARDVRCPHCQAELQASSNAELGEDGAPVDGDATICIKCGEWAIFEDEASSLRKPDDDELQEIAMDKHLRKMRAAWVAMDKEIRSAIATPDVG